MINTLTGMIVAEDGGHWYVTLEVYDVGYLVYVCERTRVKTGRIKLYVHDHLAIAQQGPSKHDLYGFETPAEVELFQALMKNVDRMGPSGALKAMNVAPPTELLQAIRMRNVAYLQRGCGQKTAEQIVLGMAKYAASTGAATKELL